MVSIECHNLPEFGHEIDSKSLYHKNYLDFSVDADVSPEYSAKSGKKWEKMGQFGSHD